MNTYSSTCFSLIDSEYKNGYTYPIYFSWNIADGSFYSLNALITCYLFNSYPVLILAMPPFNKKSLGIWLMKVPSYILHTKTGEKINHSISMVYGQYLSGLFILVLNVIKSEFLCYPIVHPN